MVARCEEYQAGDAPDGVCVITAGVDVQDNRLVIEVVGWGRDFESWSLDHREILGDPSTPAIWSELDGILETKYRLPSGLLLRIAATCIDSGGHHTQDVYRFCRTRWGRRNWAIKGVGGSRSLLGKPSRNNIGKVPIFPVGVDVAKEMVAARLRQDVPGPGYCHFPLGRDTDYFAQLTAERPVVRYKQGVPYRQWVKRPGVRNEALDCRVYSIAALEGLRVNLNQLANDLARRLGVDLTPSQTEATRRTPRRKVRSPGCAGARRGP
jgi:phage terminase large subunit GpA-like protein